MVFRNTRLREKPSASGGSLSLSSFLFSGVLVYFAFPFRASLSQQEYCSRDFFKEHSSRLSVASELFVSQIVLQAVEMKVAGVTVHAGLIEAEQNKPVRLEFITF